MASNHQSPKKIEQTTQYKQPKCITNLTLEKARGFWPKILAQLGINESCLKNKHGACPVCGGKDRFRFDNKNDTGSFYCNKCGAGDGIRLLKLYHDWSFQEAIQWVEQVIGVANEIRPDVYYNAGNPKHIGPYLPSTSHEPPKKGDKKKLAWRKNLLNKTWCEAKPVSKGDTVDCYLKARGIELTEFPEALRYHPELDYYTDDRKYLGIFPAMLGLVTDKNHEALTLHRTYLGDGCKANVSNQKKLMPSINPGASLGGAIKFYNPVNGCLILAEGIETTLSLFIATGIPAWSTVSALGLERVILPTTVTEVIIAIDNDKSNRGKEAATTLTARLLREGRVVRHVIPPKVGQDFNDLLLEGSI